MNELDLSLYDYVGGDKSAGAEVMLEEAQIYEMERKFEHNRLIKQIIAQISCRLMGKVNGEIDSCSRDRRDLRQREKSLRDYTFIYMQEIYVEWIFQGNPINSEI